MITGAMDFTVVDDMVRINDRESFYYARRLTTEEGLFAGGSSGSAVAGAIKYLTANPQYKCPVTILPDSGTRYLSKIYSDEWMRDNGFLEEPVRLGTVKDVIAGRSKPMVTVTSDQPVFKVV